MRIDRITDISIDEIRSAKYDLAFFASGYETRCCYVSSQIENSISDKSIILGFRELMDTPERIKADQILETKWKSKPIQISGNDDKLLYEILRKTAPQNAEEIHILVDYSSMSRLWYAGILNWARFSGNSPKVIIDLVYSVGRYVESNRPIVIEDILCIPGCEGGAMRMEKLIAVFGLGFNGLAALCVLDRLEADTVFGFQATNVTTENYCQTVLSENHVLIEDHRMQQPVMEIPLESIESGFRLLSELVAPYRGEDTVTIVPMGPKPHVLTAILVSMRFPEISCLRINARRDRPEKVEAVGTIVATRVLVQ